MSARVSVLKLTVLVSHDAFHLPSNSQWNWLTCVRGLGSREKGMPCRVDVASCNRKQVYPGLFSVDMLSSQPVLPGELCEIEILSTNWVNVCFEKQCVLFFFFLKLAPPLALKINPSHTHTPFLLIRLSLSKPSKHCSCFYLGFVVVGYSLCIGTKVHLYCFFCVALGATLERCQTKVVHASKDGRSSYAKSYQRASFLLSPDRRRSPDWTLLYNSIGVFYFLPLQQPELGTRCIYLTFLKTSVPEIWGLGLVWGYHTATGAPI